MGDRVEQVLPQQSDEWDYNHIKQHAMDLIDGLSEGLEISGSIFGYFMRNGERSMLRIPVMYANDEDKIQFLKDARIILHIVKAHHYILMTETWVAPDDSERPSEHPDRKDAIQVLSVNRDRVRGASIGILKHEDGVKILSEASTSDGIVMRGSFTELLLDEDIIIPSFVIEDVKTRYTMDWP